jgi:hypothetical protein
MREDNIPCCLSELSVPIYFGNLPCPGQVVGLEKSLRLFPYLGFGPKLSHMGFVRVLQIPLDLQGRVLEGACRVATL